jgi:conjugal transfer pilus assembly protein TraV
MNKHLTLLALTICLSGCAVFRGGFDGSGGATTFSCKAPDGVMCDSMTGVMANLNANNLPSQQVKHKQNKETLPSQNQARTRATQENAMPIAPYSPTPLLHQPKTLRVWVAPYESADRTLFDQQYFYMVIDTWRWGIEHNSRRLQDAYAPVGAPILNSTNSVVADPQHQSVDKEAPIPVNQGNTPTSGQLANGINTEIKDLNIDISKFTRQ